MSSNLKINKVCLYCGDAFTARTFKTKYCSHQCNRRHYKLLQRKEAAQKAGVEVEINIKGRDTKTTPPVSQTVVGITKELLTIRDLVGVTTISERTLFRLIKEPEFPKIKIGRSLRFQKESALKYITEKYTVYERNTSEKKNSKRKKG